MTSSTGSASVPPTRAQSGVWAAAAWTAVGYGVVLTSVALHADPGAELAGRFAGQPVAKALTAILLAVAAALHPLAREARWLVGALACSAAGDWLLAIPWWPPSFTAGLTGFLLAHLCFLGALRPLAEPLRSGRLRVAAVAFVCLVLLVWFWPGMVEQRMVVPVAVYVAVLAAMVVAALLARLPTRLTAIGAVCFAVSDAMIGVDRFVLGDETLAVPVWWVYATAQLLITAGFFFGRRGAWGAEAAGRRLGA